MSTRSPVDLVVPPRIQHLAPPGTQASARPARHWTPRPASPAISRVASAVMAALLVQACSSKEGGGRRSPADECDPVLQDCGSAGQRCILVRPDDDLAPHTQCSDVLGDAGDRESCEIVDDVMGEDTCAAGYFCSRRELPDADPQIRHCLPYCHDDSDCDAGNYCQSLLTSAWTGSCTLACDVFGDDCGAGLGCYISENFDTTSAYCLGAGAGQPGDPCSYNIDCAPHNTCVVFSDRTECAALCDDSNPCDAGTCRLLLGTDTLFNYCHI